MAETTLNFSPTYGLGYGDETWAVVSITCKGCGRTSHHPEDVANRYCGFCKVFHHDIPIGKRIEWAAERRRQLKL